MKKVQRSHVTSATNFKPPSPASCLDGVQSATFGGFLRHQRVARGLSRALLASRTDLEEATVEKIELNEAVPSYRDVKKLARVLKIPEQALIDAAGYLKRA
jgi:ribosome-binding protein aMBF1 (putative translation factor)